ncbi:unnamed protein product [Prorocentrum cordatum]|uniref:Cytosolic carboxypeptidase-like protein 5 n=1 Tax=Prorocentrum cordatum TaxID=2364126 RepID=A0ABN9P902_9DINO|nr:unnamed protein product [Polarella glacialis]
MAKQSESLHAFINSRASVCLNEASEYPFANCLLDDEAELRSDADHQLLLTLEFTEPVNLTSLRLCASGEEAPGLIKLFVNSQNLGFDDASSQKPAQIVTFERRESLDSVVKLTPVKFNNVHSLTVFVEENGGADESSVRYLDAQGTRVRGGGRLDARPAVSAKRQRASANGVIGEVAARLCAQSSDDGVARCLLEAASSAAPSQARDIVRKATEVFLLAAKDAGERRQRALLMLSACRCQVLCLDRGQRREPLPARLRAAMRCGVQGLMLGLEGAVDADSLRQLLKGLLTKDGRGVGDLMALLCRVLPPIRVPACDRGNAANESEDSESEASEIGEDEAGEPLDSNSITHGTCNPGTVSPGVGLEIPGSRKCSVASLVDGGDHDSVFGEDCPVGQDGQFCQLQSPVSEFLKSISIDAEAVEHWPVLYPGLGSHGLQFSSKFEGGNLRRVRLEAPGVVEILLCGDTNRAYHCQAFFFDVVVSELMSLRMHIVSLVKPGSTFGQGQRVVTQSPGESCWRRDGEDYAYMPNRYIVGDRRGNYTLSFALQLKPGRTRVAHFYPYLFGDLLCDLRRLRPSGDWLSVQDLGPTPGGRPLLMLTINDFEACSTSGTHDTRPYVIISARVHPGESPASFIMRGVLKLLLSDADEACALRRLLKFVIMPMLNPDGVAAGNGRANSAGYDLNRCWSKPPVGSEIVAVRQVVSGLCASQSGVLAFLDFHAHSRRHGAFTLSNPNSQTLPDLLAGTSDGTFDRAQCVFSYDKGKRGSARCAVWKDLGVKHSHTLEASYAAVRGKGRLITPHDLDELGRNSIRACASLLSEY